MAASFDETTYLPPQRSGSSPDDRCEVNIEQLMNADAVILVDNALETLASRTA
ncbi:MAG: hypothetical protein ACLRPT_01685 [Akkermansia muciniphila]